MTSCDFEDKVFEYLDGELSAAEEPRIRQHLVDCPECAKCLEKWSALRKTSAQLADKEYSKDFMQGVIERVTPSEKEYLSYSLWNFICEWRYELIGTAFAILLFAVQPVLQVNTNMEVMNFYGFDESAYSQLISNENDAIEDIIYSIWELQ